MKGAANEMMSHTGEMKCRCGMETLYYVALQVGCTISINLVLGQLERWDLQSAELG